MDAFNYLTAMVSVILGLGLTQLFAGIGNLVQIRRRVKLDWLHSAWVLLLIVLHIHMVVLGPARGGPLDLRHLRLRPDRARGAGDRQPHHHSRAARGPDRRAAALLRHRAFVL